MTSEPNGQELFNEERSAEVVGASFAGTPDPRLRQLMTSLVKHLHAFVKEVELTEEEWGFAIDFLTRTGHMSDDVRQEFILLSDVLGVSMLVETINHRTGGTATESTVLGPFHMVESPPREPGADIALVGKGTPCLVSGQVTGPDGEPLAGAVVVGLPDVDQRTAQRFAAGTGHLPGDQAGLALAVEGDVVPEPARRGLHHVERAEHRRLGRSSPGAVVDRLHEHRDPEDVGQQDELLPHVVAHLAGAGEERDRGAPLLLGQLHVLDECMQVVDQRGQHLPEPRVRGTGEAGGDHLG